MHRGSIQARKSQIFLRAGYAALTTLLCKLAIEHYTLKILVCYTYEVCIMCTSDIKRLSQLSSSEMQ